MRRGRPECKHALMLHVPGRLVPASQSWPGGYSKFSARPVRYSNVGSVALMGRLATPVAAETDLFGEVLHRQQDRVRRRLAKATDGGIHHRAGKLAKERVIPAILADQLHRLFAA